MDDEMARQPAIARSEASSLIRNEPGSSNRGLMSAAGPGRAEAITLHGMDACGAQEQVLLGGLDALRRDLHAEAAAEADHGVDDRGGVGGALDRMHEAAVDLELVEREAAQIEQARIAGAEVVERKPHAERLEAEHRKLGGVDVAEQRAFGDFELEPRRVEPGFGEDAFDHVDKVGAAELQRRNVDGDDDVRPGLAVDAGAAQHPFAEVDDQSDCSPRSE